MTGKKNIRLQKLAIFGILLTLAGLLQGNIRQRGVDAEAGSRHDAQIALVRSPDALYAMQPSGQHVCAPQPTVVQMFTGSVDRRDVLREMLTGCMDAQYMTYAHNISPGLPLSKLLFPWHFFW
ncbi:MAG: hypothetical protein LBR06_04515 [Bacteroidales bacterium]|nr:hypothetical protein [Bacteroidales bacterium]